MYCVFLSLGLLVILVHRSEACGLWEDGRLIYYERPPDSGKTDELFLFNLKGNDFTVSDLGVIHSGDITGASSILPFVLQPDLSTQEILISVLHRSSYDFANVVTKIVDRAIAYSSDGTALGSDACIIDTIETRLARYGHPNVTVSAASVTTWVQFVDSAEATSQAVIAFSTTGDRYVLIQYEDTSSNLDSLTPDFGGFVNLNDTNRELYGLTCFTQADDLRTMSNNHCGIPGLWVYSLDDLCTDVTPICDTLQPDIEDRSLTCREPLVPKDECNVNGFCQFVENSTDSFILDFAFNKTISHFAGFEILNGTDESGGSVCVLNATDEGNYYHVMQVVDSAFVQTCGVAVSNSNKHTFTFNQYEIGANEFLQRDSKMYRISCNPTNLPSAITLEDVDAGDIVEEKRPNTTDNGFKLLLGNQLNPFDQNYQPYNPMANVDVGDNIFLRASFDPDINYQVNAYPYGLYVTFCWISAMPHLDTDSKVLVIKDGCVVDTLFSRFTTSFKNINPVGYQPGNPYIIVAGPIRAARWRKYDSIYAICEFDVCHTYPYQESFCYDSCYGKGVNVDGDLPSQGPINKRQTSDGKQKVLLTAGLTIIDTDDSEDDVKEALVSQSCANKTMAYITISVLVILLFIATIITTLLFLQLQSRKRK